MSLLFVYPYSGIDFIYTELIFLFFSLVIGFLKKREIHRYYLYSIWIIGILFYISTLLWKGEKNVIFIIIFDLFMVILLFILGVILGSQKNNRECAIILPFHILYIYIYMHLFLL